MQIDFQVDNYEVRLDKQNTNYISMLKTIILNFLLEYFLLHN